MLASGGDDKTIKLWKLTEISLTRTLIDHTDRVIIYMLLINILDIIYFYYKLYIKIYKNI
jgi:WD40 repeat protein